MSEFKRLTNPKNLTQSYVDSEETLTSQLEVKFAQLNASVILELWSEAHNAINDIYGTLHTTKAILSKDTYITYYAQLEKLLWVSKSFAPHAEGSLTFFSRFLFFLFVFVLSSFSREIFFSFFLFSL